MKPRPFDILKFKSYYPFASREAMMLTLLECAFRPVTKTELLSAMNALFKPGYVSSDFVYQVRRNAEVFDFLVEDCAIEYKKGKPLVLADAQKTLDS
jgi:hypothetical protein